MAFSKEYAFAVEREIVTEEMTLLDEAYNLAVGGSGHAGITRRSRVVDIYDLELNYVCSKQSYKLACDFIGLKQAGSVRDACKRAELGKGSKAGEYYVCHGGGKPYRHNYDHMGAVQQKSVEHNIGKKRPEHSKLMSELNKDRQDPIVYTFKHKDGTTFIGTRKELINSFPSHNINPSELGVLIRGKYKSHRGWSL